MSNKGELTGLRCKLVKLPLLLNSSSKPDWFFSELHILDDPAAVVSNVAKNGGETQFSRSSRKLPFSPGDPGVESRVTKKGGEVRYNR